MGTLTEVTYIHTYHSRFIPEGVADVSQIFLRDTHVLPKLVSYEEHCRHDRWKEKKSSGCSKKRWMDCGRMIVAFYDIMKENACPVWCPGQNKSIAPLSFFN
jgi:hypothetical protein